MCRFVAYLGPSISLESLTTLPSHSIVLQSYRAQEREEPLNGDGFGVAWFAPEQSSDPAAYRAVTPAWSDENLLHLARVTQSRCILAHVRAATPGLGVSPFNCHPFLGDGFAFMHNGYIADFPKLKRPLLAEVSDELFYGVRGTTDSEVLFAVFRHHLATAPQGAPTVDRMRHAMNATIDRLRSLSSERNIDAPHQLNLCVSDGESIVASRYCSSDAAEPNSLYVHEGRRYVCIDGVCRMIEPDEAGGAILIASERLSEDDGWARIGVNQVISVGPDRQIQFDDVG